MHARRDQDAHSWLEAPSRPEELAASRSSHPAGAARRPVVLERSHRGDPRLLADRRAAIRATTLARRRRTTLVLVGLLALVVLALPVRALGAVTLSGQQTPFATPSGLADGSLYTVKQGDTLASIAAKVNPSNAPALAKQMAVVLGTPYVVAGERIRIP